MRRDGLVQFLKHGEKTPCSILFPNKTAPGSMKIKPLKVELLKHKMYSFYYKLLFPLKSTLFGSWHGIPFRYIFHYRFNSLSCCNPSIPICTP